VRIARFKQFLRAEDRAALDDLLSQCKLYASVAGVLSSPAREVPLLLSFALSLSQSLCSSRRSQDDPFYCHCAHSLDFNHQLKKVSRTTRSSNA
jgi:hypothetical protein